MMEARDRPEEAPVGSGRGEKRDRDRADEMTAESDEQRDRERLEGRPAERDEERDREGGPGTRGDGAGPGDGRSDKICFKCKQPGHVASRCPLGKHNAGPQDYWGTVFRVLCIKVRPGWGPAWPLRLLARNVMLLWGCGHDSARKLPLHP